MPLDVGQLLSKIAQVVGGGAFEQHQTATMGGDWRLKIEQLKAQQAAQSRAKELHGFEVRDQQAEEVARGQAQETRQQGLDAQTLIAKNTEGLGGDSPSDAGPVPLELDDAQLRARLVAKQAMEAHGLDTRKKEADIRATEATATYTEARPDIEQDKLAQRERALDAGIARAEAAGNRAEAAALQGERRLLLQEREEARRGEAMRGKSYVSEAGKAKFEGLGEGYSNMKRIGVLLQSPEASKALGPFMGRAWQFAADELGGRGLTKEQKELGLELRRAFSSAAFLNGGKALTGTELGQFKRLQPLETDTLETALVKYKGAMEVLKRNALGRWHMSSPFQQRELQRALPIYGFDPNEFPMVNDDVDGMPPRASDGGSPGAPTAPGTPAQGQAGEWRQVGKYRVKVK